MIDLFMWATPNGYKISIMLEEVGLPYRVVPVDIGKGEQFDPAFLAISPNNKIPAIVDPDGPDGRPISVFESGAILFYLARKTGRFLPSTDRDRIAVMEWLMFQMGGLGPMAGQAHHFRHYAKEDIPYAVERYTAEVARLYRVMDARLAQTPFLAGEYGIADIACFPWVRRHERHGVDLATYPHVQCWYETIIARPAVIAGLLPLSDAERRGIIAHDGSHDLLFGSGQFAGNR
ncbi:putative S-transferase [uncultured Sphingopyxis sp.]|uniref:Putative S-transferase n=1 Tax=uncultured Sphingopyxis sp. TaxID=310581 RepID=A0A1Y5PSW0_9SPHN|nr:glutathione S-transferase N-terminal domain-containing protein [uncultured Sphingopyxis sp.]SBV31796.1 putative S-transferase [uncultured Sphingopyxis sp.]